MASGSGVSSNYAVASIQGLWRSFLNTASNLRLYQNNLPPDPSYTWANFTECTFIGYAPINMAGQYPPPFQVIDGEYQMSVPVQIFTSRDPTPQIAYGAAILDNSLNLWFTLPFQSPITIVQSSNISVVLNLQEWAASVIP